MLARCARSPHLAMLLRHGSERRELRRIMRRLCGGHCGGHCGRLCASSVVAPRVILSPAHPRFGGVGTAAWISAARGSAPCRAAAPRRPSPICPQGGRPIKWSRRGLFNPPPTRGSAVSALRLGSVPHAALPHAAQPPLAAPLPSAPKGGALITTEP